MNGVQGVEGSNPFIPTRKQKPQGIYGNVDPFSVFGICPFPLSLSLFPVFRLAGHFATPDHTGQTFPAVPRIMGMVSALADLADSRQIHCPQTKTPRRYPPWRFSYVQKIRDRQTAAMLSATPLSPLSTGTKTSRDDPRVPLRLPSGKGACGNSGLRLHPAF